MIRFINLFTFLLFSVSLISGCKGNSEDSKSTIENDPYKPYVDQMESSVKNLSLERSAKRQELIEALQKNSVYKKLVIDKILSVEFLKTLTIISQGASRITSEIYSFEEEPFASIVNDPNGEDKKEFILKVVALGMDLNGGFPKEIIKIFDDYKRKYRFYGEKGAIVSDGNNTTEIPVDFDLSGFLAVVCPKDKAIMDAVFESKTKGISSWTNDPESKYHYLSSIRAYMEHLQTFYTSSQYYFKPEREISANELYSAYEENEVRANIEFNDKKLIVKGKISDFGNDILDRPFISFKIDYLKTVTCYFAEDKAHQISLWSKGENIAIIGTCLGNTLGNIVLDDSNIWDH